MSDAGTSYWDYIRVERLLDLQGGLEQDGGALSNEEHLFIVVHQVFELWFKLVIRELHATRNLLVANPVPEQDIARSAERLERVREILRLASDHFRVIETMSTRDYLAFRDKLFPASGFQSAQLREIEILIGLEDSERVAFGDGPSSWKQALRNASGDSPALARVERRLADGPNLKQVLDAWLTRTPIQGSRPADPDDEAVVERFLRDYLRGHERALERQLEAARERGDAPILEPRYRAQLEQARQFLLAAQEPEGERPRVRRLRAAAIFITSYRELPLLAWPRRLIDLVIEVEQHLIIFRQRHARMVERVIGRRVGTGGSAGVAYLDQTALDYRVFKELWAVRTLLLGVEDLPSVVNSEVYGFHGTH